MINSKSGRLHHFHAEKSAKKEVANYLAVLGTVDTLEMSQDHQFVRLNVLEPRLARIWIGTTECPPATTRRHTTRPYHRGIFLMTKIAVGQY